MDLKYAPYKKESAKSEGDGLHVLEALDLGAWLKVTTSTKNKFRLCVC